MAFSLMPIVNVHITHREITVDLYLFWIFRNHIHNHNNNNDNNGIEKEKHTHDNIEIRMQ